MKIYLSGTYKDLVEHRKAAYQMLRSMRHDVIGMEDYVASDQRPTDKVLADVAECDAYLGIFAWRYGFVPSRNNPHKRSITEIEYRRAKALKKPCMLFLLQDDAPWPVTMMDSHTDEADAGTRIKKLREELCDQHLVSFFATPDQLASRIAAAIFGVSVGAAITREHSLVPAASERRHSSGRAKPRPKYQNLWLPGSVLRVRFMDDNPSFERAVRRYLPLWSVYANIQFEFSQDDDAEVRVAFKKGTGNWAYVGTDCMKTPLDQSTMNFSFLDAPEFAVLHEFGHVLGLLHEHNQPNGIKWNKQLVYKTLSLPPNNWSKPMIDSNMLAKWPATAFPKKKPFDPISIMAYPIPKDWMALNAEFGHKGSLSAVDKKFIECLYPFE